MRNHLFAYFLLSSSFPSLRYDFARAAHASACCSLFPSSMLMSRNSFMYFMLSWSFPFLQNHFAATPNASASSSLLLRGNSVVYLLLPWSFPSLQYDFPRKSHASACCSLFPRSLLMRGNRLFGIEISMRNSSLSTAEIKTVHKLSKSIQHSCTVRVAPSTGSCFGHSL